MQTSYQPLIKIDESTPYSPGFPMRAYEFGTYPYQGMFEASFGLSIQKFFIFIDCRSTQIFS